MSDWIPTLSDGSKPRYIAIAEAIQGDLAEGRLLPAQRLPAQRQLARLLGLDFTTVARGYGEAQRRGLIESRVGEGTFVLGVAAHRQAPATRVESEDFSMNMPPEPADAALWTKLGSALESIGRDLASALRYQRFGGTESNKQAAVEWLSRSGVETTLDRVFVVPGGHAALLGAMTVLSNRNRGAVLVETLTYPGIKAIAEQLGLALVGLPRDQHGLSPEAFSDACRHHRPSALYLNPTLANPTTQTIPIERRQEIAAIARSAGVPILEDDPYGLLLDETPAAFASVAPDITWHVATLSKCLGAGLRVAFVVVPDAPSGWDFSAAVRTANVMVSPVTATLATHWIQDGTADALLAAIRAEFAGAPGACRRHPAERTRYDRPGCVPPLDDAATPMGPVRIRKPYGVKRSRRRRQRCLRNARFAAGGGPHLPRRTGAPLASTNRAAIRRARTR